jgi:ferredoxin
MGLRDRLKKRVSKALGRLDEERPAEEKRAAPEPPAAPSPVQPPRSGGASRRSRLLRQELDAPPEAAEPAGAEAPPPPAAAPPQPTPALSVPAISPASDGLSERAAPGGAPAAPSEEAAAPVISEEPDPYTARCINPEDDTVLVFGVREDETVCEAADRAGVELPSSCRSGGCLVCTGRLIEGEVVMGEQYVLEEEDIAQSFRLLCSTTLRSDAVFYSHQEKEVEG